MSAKKIYEERGISMYDKEVILRRVIKDRIPHFHQDFPLTLFWSQKSGCTALANGFSFKLAYLNKHAILSRDSYV